MRKHALTRRITSTRSKWGGSSSRLVSPLDEEDAFTEEQRHRLVQPLAGQRDKMHPQEQELGAQVDRTRFGEDVRILRRTEEVAKAGADKEPDGGLGLHRRRRTRWEGEKCRTIYMKRLSMQDDITEVKKSRE